jgi:hypothetical protein
MRKSMKIFGRIHKFSATLIMYKGGPQKPALAPRPLKVYCAYRDYEKVGVWNDAFLYECEPR